MSGAVFHAYGPPNQIITWERCPPIQSVLQAWRADPPDVSPAREGWVLIRTIAERRRCGTGWSLLEMFFDRARISCHAALSTPADAAPHKESRMNFANATTSPEGTIEPSPGWSAQHGILGNLSTTF
jgi:hypothetical protein